VESCPACGALGRELQYDNLTDQLFGVGGAWRYVVCADCCSLFADPRLSRAAIGRAYRRYYTHERSIGGEMQDGASMGVIRRWRRGVRNGYLNAVFGYRLVPASRSGKALGSAIPRVRRHSERWIRHLPLGHDSPRLLDVGCGDGGFVAQMTTLGWSAEGIDPDPVAVQRGQHLGRPLSVADLSTYQGDEQEGFDAITLAHVIEHLHAPREALDACYRLLQKGGTIWIATPNCNAIGHKLFGQWWRGLEPPRHLVVFQPHALAELVAGAGFQHVEIRSTQPLGSRMFGESQAISEGAGRSRRSFTKALYRLAAVIADWVAGRWPSLGEEIVVVARKGEADDPAACVAIQQPRA
jgi:SAM-dependent methyltransferase